MMHTHANAASVLEIARQLAVELHPHKASMSSITLDSSLERDLGLDSLGRMELLQRLERVLQVRLPEQLLVSAETPRDLLRGIQGAEVRSTAQPIRQVPLQEAAETLTTPMHAQTLIEVLEWHVQQHPQRPHIHLYGEEETEDIITYGALYERALAVAAGLHKQGMEPGQTVGLMLPTGTSFFDSFFGILLAGGIPIPIYPPLRLTQLEEHLRRQANILANARTVLLITVPEAQPLARILRAQVLELRSVVTPAALAALGDAFGKPPVHAQDVAFIQYTSGSTGVPKGVILTHANLLANIRAMNQVAQTTAADVFVSWLPLYHDMGLIGAWLSSLYCAFQLVLMSPLAFLARPERWLWTIHTHRGTMSGAPNFAYELCAQRLDAAALSGLDLSSWRLAFNGAEPVSPETLRRFTARFAPYGFHPEAMTPVYGLAEASLGLAFPPPGRGAYVDRIQREPFMRRGRVLPAAQDDPHALGFVACGYPLPGHHIRIVDATGFEVPEGQEGRLEFRGPSATSGYFRNAEATAALFRGEWLDSGDLAYISAGEVYLTGRAKDIIIRAGRNLYPHELEEAVGNVPGIRKGCVAVFGSNDAVSRTERLVVLAETRETDIQAQQALRQQIEALFVDRLGLPPDDVVLAPPHTVLKTSSGKLRRTASRTLYEQGKIGTKHRAVWWQIARLVALAVKPQLHRGIRTTLEMLYTIYAWMLAGLFAPLAWGSVVLLPQRLGPQAAARMFFRGAFKLAGIPLIVEGLEQLPNSQACVIVANHASYLDALVLVATLPGNPGYVAKQELATAFLTRLPLQRLGVEFVERFEAQRGVEDTARVVKAARQGRAMVFFPEGTFGREPGLRPFRMGAFVVAAQANVPVVPVAIRGTRSILRSDQWFIRRGIVHVRIGTPILPSGMDWTAAVTLRDAVRAQLLRHCGEPDLESGAPFAMR
jgi:1-acyl-sn-glycerol-3-phosphate acyltransferase